MALKRLKLQKQLMLRKTAFDALAERETKIQKRSEELEAAIEEAKTDEDMTLIEGEVEEHEKKKADFEKEKTDLENEIRELETELDELASKEPEGRSQAPAPVQTRSATGTAQVQNIFDGVGNMKVNKTQLRAAIRESLNKPEIRDFYSNVREVIMNKRAVANADLTIPTEVLDRIQPLIGEHSKLYAEVEVVQLNGEGRAIIDGAIPEGIWVEMVGAVQELEDAFDAVEIDGYKVGGFVPVPNSVLDDSMINLAMHIENRIARAIGKALDKAILKGTGAAGKQPVGVIPTITANAVDSESKLGALLSNLATVETDEDDSEEVIAVMNRKTYFKQFMPQTVATTSDGRQVVQDVRNANLAGLRVVLTPYMDDDKVLFGAFKRYMLGERQDVTLTSSTEVRFIEDQTVFKGIARYDGKPVKASAFQLVNIVAAPAGA